MRFGLWSIGMIFLFVFLLIISSGQGDDEKIDKLFEGIDANFSRDFDANGISDNNLSKFVKYTVTGMFKEVHGGYYLAAWLNTFLPPIIMENLVAIVILFVLALIAPLLYYGFLILVFIVLEVNGKLKERRKVRSSEEKRTK